MNFRRVSGLLALAVVAGGLLLQPFFQSRIVYIAEEVSFFLSPSPEKAFTYGERHFNASDVSDYDIDRAQYFFKLAATGDPRIPYLYHELARISFLRGNFRQAIAQIDFQISMHGDSEPSSYYVRGLIEGYMGLYDASINDYQYFLTFDPHDWAAINDYCWVLLKAGRAHDAAVESALGLELFPDNPWLLNTNAIALYETGNITAAREVARKALVATKNVTTSQWLVAYPGNDPAVADVGVASFQKAARENMHSIVVAAATGAVQ